MSRFIQVISIWPISVSIAENLTYGDLLKVSRLNSGCRAALHGFPFLSKNDVPSTNPRPHLFIGQHRTKYWDGLKKISLSECSEPHHTKGGLPQCCRYCSMPVCEACVVKESFRKNEPTFKSRWRYLCVDCWTAGNPHAGRHPTGPSPPLKLSYNFAPGTGDFCVCTVRDGWLCLTCKTEQNANAKDTTKCIGEGCGQPVEEDKESRRICLWCDLPLIKRQHRTVNRDPRKEYDFGYIHEGKPIKEDCPINSKGKWTSDQRSRGEVAVRNSRLTDVERRRVELLLKPDDEGARYVRHLAEIDYRGLGLRKPSRGRILDSMNGIYKYDRDFLQQFEGSCMKTPSEDWWLWLVKIMGVEKVEGALEPGEEDVEDESDSSTDSGQRPRKKGKYHIGSLGQARNSKEKTASLDWTTARESAAIDDTSITDEDSEAQDSGNNFFNTVRARHGQYPLVPRKSKSKGRITATLSRSIEAGPSERPPDYEHHRIDLLLNLD